MNELFIFADQVHIALKTWGYLFNATQGNLANPDVAATDAGGVLLVWRRGDQYLSLMISPGESPEFFYRDSGTGEIWGLDYDPNSEEIPEELAGKLRLFTKN